MNNTFHNLPMELVNKILIMRPTHPVANLIKLYIRRFRRGIKNYDGKRESEHILFFPKYIFNKIFENNLSFRMYEDETGRIRTHHNHDVNCRYDEFDIQQKRQIEYEDRFDEPYDSDCDF
jgi:hypothetical protein